MEYTGFEPVASTMRMWRAPNCANTPYENYITKEQNFKYVFRRKLYCIKTIFDLYNITKKQCLYIFYICNID